MGKPIYRIDVSDEEFRERAERVFLHQLRNPDIPPNSWAHDMLKKGFTFVLKGEFHAALDMAHLIHERDHDGFCSIGLGAFPVSVFWNSWELLEDMVPEHSPCECCGEETDKTGLLFLHDIDTEIDSFWDVFWRQVKTGPGRKDYKAEEVKTACEGCFLELKEIADKMDAVEHRLRTEYSERYGEDFPLEGPIGDAFWNERWAEWKPLLAQISTPWKFKEES